MSIRVYAVALAFLMGTTACATLSWIDTFSKPKPPPTVTFQKEALQRSVRNLDLLFGKLFVVVNADCARLQKTRPTLYKVVADDCPTLGTIKGGWDQTVTDLSADIAAAPEGATVDLDKLTAFLLQMAILAAKLAVLV